ncbi:MAG: efflux RND transporter permease subunit, partial [Gemmatimonadaceae bacterium]|nr:efflux RND transporter permease subunit [Gemmatimonadaceae bacterium]
MSTTHSPHGADLQHLNLIGRIARFAVRNAAFSIVLLLALVAVGASAFLTIPREEDPSIQFPAVTVVAIYPGASPVDLEQLVVDPSEKRIKELDKLKSIKTTIEDGTALLNVEFQSEEDPEKKYDEVLREVNALRPDLPAELYRLEVNRQESNRVNIVQVALVSPSMPYQELDVIGRRFKDDLAKVPGVRRVRVWGLPTREARVSVDLGKLAQRQLPLAQLLGALQSEAANIPGGSVDVGDRRYNVKTSGSYTSLDEVRNTVVGSAGGRIVRVGDVADVTWSTEETKHVTRYNGQRAVFVTANMQKGQNIVTVRDRLWAELDRLERTLPPSVTLARGFDQSANVKSRLSRLGVDFAIAIGLVLITLLPLGLRAAGIVMVSIPLSIAVGVALLSMVGFSLNQLSIVGFVIALGLLVDDSIVVVENIERFLRDGVPRRVAATLATNQIAVAVLGCTATLMLAFVPLLLLPGGPGKFIRGLPVAVVSTIMASLLVSLTIIPFLASRLLADKAAGHSNIFLRGLNRVIDVTYGRWLHLALARPLTALAASALLFVASLALVPSIGFSLFPVAGTPRMLVTVETPNGASLAETDEAVRHVERVLGARNDVRHIYANVGRSNPDIYYNLIARNESPSVGEAFVLIDEYDPNRTPLMFDSLRAQFDAYPKARIEVKEFENGPPIDAPIALRLQGKDLDTLQLLAGQLAGILRSVEGTRTVRNPLQVARTDLKVAVDQQKAGLLGVSTVDVDRTVRLALAGVTAGAVRAADGQEYDVTVRTPRPEAGVLASALGGSLRDVPSLEALDRIYVPSLTGATVPLTQVAKVGFARSPSRIEHYGAERSITVTANVRSGYNTDAVTRAVLSRVEGWTLPAGYEMTVAGEVESRQESFGGIGSAVLLAMFGILAVLVLEFGSFAGTLIVASVIPLGIVGGLVALWVTGYSLSFTAMIGFVALIGIEIKNSILLVDFTNQLREQGVGLDEAIEEAGRIRFLPIVLTTLTAIGGLLPLAVQGSGLYSPLAVVIIGGLISSTLLSRLVTPVMYKLLPPVVEDGEAVVEA